MHVLCGRERHAPPGAHVTDGPRSTKVTKLDLAVIATQAVLRLDITVHVAGVVHMLHTIHDLDACAQHLVPGQSGHLSACTQDTVRPSLAIYPSRPTAQAEIGSGQPRHCFTDVSADVSGSCSTFSACHWAGHMSGQHNRLQILHAMIALSGAGQTSCVLQSLDSRVEVTAAREE